MTLSFAFLTLPPRLALRESCEGSTRTVVDAFTNELNVSDVAREFVGVRPKKILAQTRKFIISMRHILAVSSRE